VHSGYAIQQRHAIPRSGGVSEVPYCERTRLGKGGLMKHEHVTFGGLENWEGMCTSGVSHISHLPIAHKRPPTNTSSTPCLIH
jgi:hypothetical protein